MKFVNVRYFASLREKAGREDETFATAAQTYGDLYQELSARHGFPLPLSMVQVAVNEEFLPKTNEVREGDRIVFIPPVAGG